MLSSVLKHSLTKPKSFRPLTAYSNTPLRTSRLLATVTNAQVKDARARRGSAHATPISRERATFTIKNGPIFHGKSFGAQTNISGEAVFTTS